MEEDREMMPDNKRIGFIGSLIGSQLQLAVSYHNHKEMMAWLATGAYLIAAAMIGIYLTPAVVNNWWTILLYNLLVTVGLIVFFLFIHMQFIERWRAADRVKGLMLAWTSLLHGEVQLTAEFTQPIQHSTAQLAVYPRFVNDYLDACKTTRSYKQAFYSLRHPLKVDPRWKTELASYALLGLSWLAVNCLVWLSPLDR